MSDMPPGFFAAKDPREIDWLEQAGAQVVDPYGTVAAAYAAYRRAVTARDDAWVAAFGCLDLDRLIEARKRK